MPRTQADILDYRQTYNIKLVPTVKVCWQARLSLKINAEIHQQLNNRRNNLLLQKQEATDMGVKN